MRGIKMLRKPEKDEYPEYYSIYIDPMPEIDILDYYEKQTKTLLEFYQKLKEKELQYSYAEGKWSIKGILIHLLDSEIIMAYRALTYARGDQTDLPLYDHDEYMENETLSKMNSKTLIDHYSSVRQANLFLFNSFSDSDWLKKGLTGGNIFTARTIPFILSGHTNHHFNVIKERYI
jgi:hypothetical protein